ncbi:MAG: hypothetical protein C4324_07225 [Blastocatellia bacterium]
MKALILAGGKGTRLRPLTVYTPKPIVPIANRHFLIYQIEILARAGINDITLSLGYQPNRIEDVIGDGRELGVTLSFVTEASPLGTAGAYRFAAGAEPETMIVLNGDILTDLDISSLISFHRKTGAEATISLAMVEDASKYGLVVFDSENRVLEFREKPAPYEIPVEGSAINAGIYVLEPAVAKSIAEGENASFEYQVFPALLAAKRPFYAFPMNGSYWRDIGTHENYLAANLDILKGRIGNLGENRISGAEIATKAFVDQLSLIGEKSVVKPGAQVLNSVIGPGVQIEEKAFVENSVIWQYSRVATSASVKGAIIGAGSHIGRNAKIGPGRVLGNRAVIPDYSVI